MKHESINSIQDELSNIVTCFFRDEKTFMKMDLVSRYETVYETVSFLFEDYRSDFTRLVQQRFYNELSDEQMVVEEIVFTSWVTIQVLRKLSDHIAPFEVISHPLSKY